MDKENWQKMIVGVQEMSAEIAETEDVMPMAHVVVRQDPMTGQRFNVPGLILMPGEFAGDTPERVDASKAAFKVNVQALTCAGDAEGVVLVVEAWCAAHDDLEPGQRPADNPEVREERLLVFAEHEEHGSSSANARVYRDGGRRYVEAWSDTGTFLRNAFAGVLQSNQPEGHQKIARLYLQATGAYAIGDPGAQA